MTDYRLPITGMDLMRALMHEIGHLLWYEHSEDLDDLMAPTLAAVRPSSLIPDPSSLILPLAWTTRSRIWAGSSQPAARPCRPY